MSSPWNWDRVLYVNSCIESRYDRFTHSYMTIETASFKMLSPKMTEYSFGSTRSTRNTYRTLSQFHGEDIYLSSLFHGVGIFLFSFFVSMILGVA
jgi:hypothetical protein